MCKKRLKMNYVFASLAVGLTTVFAWAPASILLLLAFVGVYTGVLYIEEVGFVRLFALCLLSVCALAGYLGLTSICWGLKLKPLLRLLCLACGTLALSTALVLGHLSGNPLLQISFNIEQIYLFVCPLGFLLFHFMRDAKRLTKTSKAYS
jgi:hypothetical protein